MRISSLIAKVRISRLVQNGMVMRKSQSARLAGGRVAMNHAVGKPTMSVMSVVSTESFTERPEDRQMRVGEADRVVEDVALEQDREPAFGRGLPRDARIVAGLQERIDRHDEERPRRPEDQQDQRGGWRGASRRAPAPPSRGPRQSVGRGPRRPSCACVPGPGCRLRRGPCVVRSPAHSPTTWSAPGANSSPTRSPSRSITSPEEGLCSRATSPSPLSRRRWQCVSVPK